MSTIASSQILSPELVRLAAHPATKEAAIREAAQMLVAAGRIDPAYVESMMRREAAAETFLGHGVAIPHGMIEDRAMVRQVGLAILQAPEGVTWNEGQTVRLVVAIAAQSDAHLDILRRLTRLLQDEAAIDALTRTTDPREIVAALTDAPVASIPVAAPAVDLAERFDWICDYPSGLHARPAARWVDAARRTRAVLRIRRGDEAADPRSLVSLLRLGLREGDRVVVSAEGDGADEALVAMKAIIVSLTAQEKADAAKAAASAAAPGWTPPAPMPSIPGISASPGLAVGRVHVVRPAEMIVPDVPLPLVEGGNRLDEAIVATKRQLAALADDTGRRLGAAEAGIFTAQAEFLADADLVTLACQLMVEGHGPAWAWREAMNRTADRIAAVSNPLLAARAADLRDVGRRVLARLAPEIETVAAAEMPEGPVILVADDFTPSDTAALDIARIVALATARGGPTSHTAILARTLGLPALVAAGEAVLDIAEGATAILDGARGRLWLDPNEAAIASAHERITAEAARRARESEDRAAPAVTTDGRRIEIAANVNTPDQAALAVELGAEGVGLMRTEFLFLERSVAPNEDEQTEIYARMLDALQGRPLIVRALDIGGDKQVSYLDLPHEANPFLGLRGARLLLRRPDLMEPQLRALYRAAKGGRKLSIMFPMITSLQEIVVLRAACERIRAELARPRCRSESWWRCPPPRSSPISSPPTSTSFRSAPTI